MNVARLDPAQQNLNDFFHSITYTPDIDILEQAANQPEAVYQEMNEKIVADQSALTPNEALESGNVIGIIASISTEDIGKKFLVYGIDSLGQEPRFIGVVLVTDTVAQNDWDTILSSSVYRRKGFNDIPWIADIPSPMWNLLPTGVTNDPNNTKETRPGVLLISPDKYKEITATNQQHEINTQ